MRLPAALVTLATVGVAAAPAAAADNRRLNDAVVAGVYTAQHRSGCRHDVVVSPALRSAAQRYAADLLAHRGLDGQRGSDGSTAQDRAAAAGFAGAAAQTVAINPALAINGLEVFRQWFADPVAYAVMTDCRHSAVGVWSENSLDRSVLVAVFGQPA